MMIKTAAVPKRERWIDPEVVLVAVGCLVLVGVGGALNSSFLTPHYLLQQLQVGAFYGIIATGAMFVILLGHIDLSVPWTVTGTAILMTTMAGHPNPLVSAIAIPTALLAGAVVGTVNGVGVAVFRIPSMVWTLAMNSILLGLSVFLTSGHKPKGHCPQILITLAHGRILGIPCAILAWAAVGLAAAFVLRRTIYGKYLYALGNSEKAVYLSGVRSRLIITLTFTFAGVMTTLGGLLLAGYANQAYQGMGDALTMPILASVVIGGTSILGGRGTYIGTVLGVVFITLLSSILSVMQMPDAVRQIIFGAMIIVILLFHRFGGKHA